MSPVGQQIHGEHYSPAKSRWEYSIQPFSFKRCSVYGKIGFTGLNNQVGSVHFLTHLTVLLHLLHGLGFWVEGHKNTVQQLSYNFRYGNSFGRKSLLERPVSFSKSRPIIFPSIFICHPLILLSLRNSPFNKPNLCRTKRTRFVWFIQKMKYFVSINSGRMYI